MFRTAEALFSTAAPPTGSKYDGKCVSLRTDDGEDEVLYRVEYGDTDYEEMTKAELMIAGGRGSDGYEDIDPD